MIEMHNQIVNVRKRIEGGGTLYAVCPNASRNQLVLTLLSSMKQGDMAHGKTYSIGKGTLRIASPTDDLPKESYMVTLVTPSEAQPDEFKAMLKWRDKAQQVVQ